MQQQSALFLSAVELTNLCTKGTLVFVTRGCNCISGVFVVSPANPPERAHLSPVQSQEPLSEPQKAQEETGWMKSRRLWQAPVPVLFQ